MNETSTQLCAELPRDICEGVDGKELEEVPRFRPSGRRGKYVRLFSRVAERGGFRKYIGLDIFLNRYFHVIVYENCED